MKLRCALQAFCNVLNERDEKLEYLKSLVNNSQTVTLGLTKEIFTLLFDLESKKGMFTDMLVPLIQVPVKSVAQYEDTEGHLRNPKMIKNVVRLLKHF